jgi:hypothetical protein
MISISEVRSMRALVDIPNHQLEELKAVCAARKISRAELVRQAISAFIQQNRLTSEEAFGVWKSQGAIFPCEDGSTALPEDGLAYQEKLRGEW